MMRCAWRSDARRGTGVYHTHRIAKVELGLLRGIVNSHVRLKHTPLKGMEVSCKGISSEGEARHVYHGATPKSLCSRYLQFASPPPRGLHSSHIASPPYPRPDKNAPMPPITHIHTASNQLWGPCTQRPTCDRCRCLPHPNMLIITAQLATALPPKGICIITASRCPPIQDLPLPAHRLGANHRRRYLKIARPYISRAFETPKVWQSRTEARMVSDPAAYITSQATPQILQNLEAALL
ncbi:hypothetical protein B0H10DRAFT_397114 [Mycena sp. CBHHK59/15]|nr:hypothetical protein B0H10DRAFT_397114 [Mycena sp. CBHHK59/15]